MSSVFDRPILEFERVTFGYAGEATLIRALSFSVGNGEFVGLLGANGSGKSTILKLAGGILLPGGGAVRLWEKELSTYRNRDRAKLICYFPQVLDMNVPFTVREVAGMGRYPYDIPPYITIDEAIAAVGLREKAETPVGNLSGGERRRAFLAMTLVQGAGIVLLDEPLANLDIRYQIELMNLLKDLQKKREMTVVMALHDINMALEFEKVMLIRSGAILGLGDPRSVLTGEALHEAFGVHIEIRQEGAGRAFISYRDIVRNGDRSGGRSNVL